MKTKHKILVFIVLIHSILKAQITIQKPSLDLGACSFPSSYFTLGNIVLIESQNGDFSVGSNRTIVVNAPTGIEFQTAIGSISATNGRNLSNELLTVTSTSLTIQYNCNGTNKLDVLTISGIKIRATSAGSYSFVRNAGNGVVNGFTNGTTLTGIISFSLTTSNQYRTNPTISGFLDWNLPSTWECNAIPPIDGSAEITIRAYQNGNYSSSNSVYFNGNPNVKSLMIESNANFSPPTGSGQTLIVNESFIIQSGGTLQQINWSQSGINNINIGGNFINNGSMISTGGNGGNGLKIVMNGTSPQTVSGTGNYRMIGNGPGVGSFVITNPIGVEMQSNFLTDNSNGNLGTVIVDGLLTFQNPSIKFTGIGNLQLNGKTILKAGTFNEHYAMTGTRTIGNTSTIEYTNSNSSISSTNIPSLNFNNLTINNTLNGITTVSNPLTVGGTLVMNGGNILNGGNVLQIGTSTLNKGALNYTSGAIIGSVKRWFFGVNNGNSSGLFPVGNSIDFQKRFAKIEYTQATGGGSIVCDWINQLMGNNVTNQPIQTNCNGFFTISNTASGYWNMTPSDGITNSENNSYNITFSATNLNDFSNDCHITAVKRDNTNLWSVIGTHIDNAGNAANPIVTRMNAKGWSNWGLGGSGDPLPVELSSMNLSCNENEVFFRWTTASEFNSESFLLEKSENCIEWIKTKEIQAAGFSNELLNYVVADIRISGLNYYRLSQKDLDGKRKIYEPLLLDCKDENPVKILVWPNPENSGFHLFVNDVSLVGECIISMKNYLGEIVLEQKIHCESGSNIFDFSHFNFSNGVYFIQVSNDNYFSEVIKHLVQ